MQIPRQETEIDGPYGHDSFAEMTLAGEGTYGKVFKARLHSDDRLGSQ